MDPIILPRISNQKPLVSVVSLTYNHEPYIRDCLEGFVMQKTNFPVEIIIHDDASTDHTADIIREYYDKRPDLFHVIIERENLYSQHKPVLAPLLMQAQGKYIALCEGDDYWTDPLKLQKQFDYMEANPEYSCCFHNAVCQNEKSRKRNPIYKRKVKQHVLSMKEIIRGAGIMPTASLFFHKKDIIDFEIYREGCPVGDYPLVICLSQKGKIEYVDELMSVYRIGCSGSWSNTHKDKEKGLNYLKAMIAWLDNIEEIIHSRDDIEYYKGACTVLSFELEGNYRLIKQNELAMKYIRSQPILRRLKYVIKCNMPFVVSLKRFFER